MSASPAAREALLARLRADPRTATVIDAIAAVPREAFVPPGAEELAYEDVAIGLSYGATISAPSMVAEMLAALDLRGGERVLELGSGSGYAAATVVASGATVVGVEIDPVLVERATRTIAATGFGSRCELHVGDGALGWLPGAPYDRVLASASIPAVPAAWIAQLAPGGSIVYPEAGADTDTLVRLTDTPTGLRREELGLCRFVPMRLPGGGNAFVRLRPE